MWRHQILPLCVLMTPFVCCCTRLLPHTLVRWHPHKHTQLLEERRLHEMTSLKLARSAEDAAEHARIDSQRGLDNVQVVELKNKCRQLELHWQLLLLQS